jgi:hypothetical protein
MEPNRFGRGLGIGLRVASRMVRERVAQPSSSAAAHAAASPPQPTATQARPGRNLVEPARRVGVGTRRFGQAFFGPFARVSRSLLLELSGLLFAMFALFFAQNAWRTRASAVRGPDHAHFLLYLIIGAVFLYFSISSFFKANRRGKRA